MGIYLYNLSNSILVKQHDLTYAYQDATIGTNTYQNTIMRTYDDQCTI